MQPAPRKVEEGRDSDRSSIGSPAAVKRRTTGSVRRMVGSLSMAAAMEGSDQGLVEDRPVVDVSVSGSERISKGRMLDHLRAVKEGTTLDPKVVQSMQVASPEMLAFLQSSTGWIQQGFVILMYTLNLTASVLLTDLTMKARPKVHPVSLFFVQYPISILIGLALTIGVSGLSGLRAELRDTVKNKNHSLMIPSACFALGSLFSTLAHGTQLDAGVVLVLGQMRLPINAVLSTIILKKEYSFLQWVTLLVITCSAVSVFGGVKERNDITDSREKRNSTEYFACEGPGGGPGACEPAGAGGDAMSSGGTWMGVVFISLWIACSCIGGVLSEKYLKRGNSPLYVQRVFQGLGSVLINVPMAFVVPVLFQQDEPERQWWRETVLECEGGGAKTVGGDGLFANWGILPALTVATWVANGWLSSYLVKALSMLTRSIVQTLSLVLVVCATELFMKVCWAPPLPIDTGFGMAVVTFAVLQFALLGMRPK